MKNKLFALCIFLLLLGCQEPTNKSTNQNQSSTKTEDTSKDLNNTNTFHSLTKENAEKLAKLPLACLQMEYPNKPGEVLDSGEDIMSPREMHPAFYGCFDWHSCVHGHWSLVNLLKRFPDLKEADTIKKRLLENISKENIIQEAAYLKKNQLFERTYGWAWALKLAEEIHTWDDSIAKPLEHNLQPLTDEIVELYKSFLPKLTNPIRVGQHENTAFGLVFAYDYAETVGDEGLKDLISKSAKFFYLKDKNCPINYEPDGFDFLSPCLEEVDIMERVLSQDEFISWVNDFMPQLMDVNYNVEVGKVTDREDGKLVHLDGLNYSRAWVFYDLAHKYNNFSHLKDLGDRHFQYSFEATINDQSYMGSHWLGSFALYALNRREVE